MKLLKSLVLAALTSVYVNGHYIFDHLSLDGVEHTFPIRSPADYRPITLQEFPSPNFYCNKNTSPATGTAEVVAGVTDVGMVTRTSPTGIWHSGPGVLYLGKVPEGETVDSWDGSGRHWFKLAEWGVEEFTGSGKTKFWLEFKHGMYTTIPKETPSGDYLLRAEHLNLNSGGTFNQFYISCAQIKITNGGSGTPGPLVDLLSYFDPSDPNVNVAPWGLTNFTVVGPPVWRG